MNELDSDLTNFLSSSLAKFVRSEEEDEIDQLFRSLTDTELGAEISATKQHTVSSIPDRAATAATTETLEATEPTTSLNSDVLSKVACPSRDALNHTRDHTPFATASKSDLQTFVDKTKNYNTTKTTLTWIK